MAEEKPERPAEPQFPPQGNPYLAGFLAWLLPGLGHFYLGRRGRGVLFGVLVLTAIAFAVGLEGRFFHFSRGEPFSYAATATVAATGVPYLVLRARGYEGNTIAPGFEYGSAFLLSAGLMNLLLILDAWDISRGQKK